MWPRGLETGVLLLDLQSTKITHESRLLEYLHTVCLGYPHDAAMQIRLAEMLNAEVMLRDVVTLSGVEMSQEFLQNQLILSDAAVGSSGGCISPDGAARGP